jgi:hypothetical protein
MVVPPVLMTCKKCYCHNRYKSTYERNIFGRECINRILHRTNGFMRDPPPPQTADADAHNSATDGPILPKFEPIAGA